MLKPALGFLRALFGIGTPPVDPDGFGQSIADDNRFLLHFRQCRRATVVWRIPTNDEARAIDADPIIGRFGDLTIGVADVDGRRWIVRERDWHGWPDPPRFVFFAMEGDKVWAGADFDRWPGSWWPPEREAMGLRP
jgi:hypothetical protein